MVSSGETQMQCLLDRNVCLQNEFVSLKSAVQKLNKYEPADQLKNNKPFLIVGTNTKQN